MNGESWVLGCGSRYDCGRGGILGNNGNNMNNRNDGNDGNDRNDGNEGPERGMLVKIGHSFVDFVTLFSFIMVQINWQYLSHTHT